MFYALPNLSSHKVFELEEPWNFEPKTPAPFEIGKAAVAKWELDPNTEAAFISGYEGMSANVRVTKDDNPPFRMHAFISDHDVPLSSDPVQDLKDNAPVDFWPNYVVETTQGRGRLVWIFESAMPFLSKDHNTEFVKLLCRRLQLPKWLPGAEMSATTDFSHYYQLGKKWMPVRPDAVIPTQHLQLWYVQATKNVKLGERKHVDYKIPMEDLEREVHARFPGGWSGPFEVGARGRRFWSPDATNPTAAVVCEDGILCFSGDIPFMSWKKLFGQAFVEKYEAEHISDVISNIAVTPMEKYWVRNPDDTWDEMTLASLVRELKLKGFSTKTRANETYSDQDVILVNIRTQNLVQKALPFLYFPPGIMVYKEDGKRYLNYCNIKTMAPAPPFTDRQMSFGFGRKYFPFIYRLLKNMLTLDGDTTQLVAFLAWFKYAYENAYKRHPEPGQAVVLAGPPGRGKTLLSRLIVSPILGGFSDGGDHLAQGTRWTANILERPVLAVDDQSFVSDPSYRKQFTERLKKYASTAMMPYEAKYKEGQDIPWFGRIIVTCNLDDESLRILPDMDVGTRDKISLFKVSEKITHFPSRTEITKILAGELPMFARFLLEWPMPEERKYTRFGVLPYHHPDLMEESRQQGLGNTLEIISNYLDAFFSQPSRANQKYWEGSAMQLFHELAEHSPVYMRNVNEHSLAIQLGKLAANEYNLVKHKIANRGNVWYIGRNIYQHIEGGLKIQDIEL